VMREILRSLPSGAPWAERAIRTERDSWTHLGRYAQVLVLTTRGSNNEEPNT